MNYKLKYFKYKHKYNKLKIQIGGNNNYNVYAKKPKEIIKDRKLN